MAIKSESYVFKGMNRDLSESKVSNLYAYEIRNLKIISDEHNTQLSISNIKGTKDTKITILGIPIGQIAVDNNLIVFCCGEKGHEYVLDFNPHIKFQNIPCELEIIIPDIHTEGIKTDYIYLISKIEDSYILKFVKGLLGFNAEYPIEATSFIENDKIKKVYWTDGINQLRFILLDTINNNTIKSSDIDFLPILKSSKEKLTVTALDSTGIFPPGTVLYVFTYFNYYGQQSDIFKISSLYYNASDSTGLSTEKSSSKSYKIELKNLDSSYSYVRIYSIVSSSPNAAPEVKIINDVKIENNSISYTDRNTFGQIIDPTELFYVGGEYLIAQTLTLKNNTLFVGNIETKNVIIPEDIRKSIKNLNILFYLDPYKKLIENSENKYYTKDYWLSEPSNRITTFKCGDYYRFGILLLHESGKWSEPLYISDKQNNIFPSSKINLDKQSHEHLLVSAKCTIELNIIKNFKKYGYIKIRPVIVYPALEDREVLCQGYVSPTVYNLGNRCNGTAFVLSSWFARPFTSYKFYPAPVYNNNYKGGNPIEFRHNAYIGGAHSDSLEIQGADRYTLVGGNNEDKYDYLLVPVTEVDNIDNFKYEHTHLFFVDNSIITMHSPEFEFDEFVKTLNISNYKFRIVGYAPLTGNKGDIDIILSRGPIGFINDSSLNDGFVPFGGDTKTGFHKIIKLNVNYSNFGHCILCSGQFYRDGFNWNNGYIQFLNNNYPSSISHNAKYEFIMGYLILPFMAGGSIKGDREEGLNDSKIQYKRISNVRYSYGNKYLKDNLPITISDIKKFDSDVSDILNIEYQNKSIIYKGNIDDLITCKYASDGSIKNGCRTYLGPHAYADLLVSNPGINISPKEALELVLVYEWGNINTSPIVMRYKSTPHCVISLGFNNDTQNILPVVSKNRIKYNTDTFRFIWDRDNPIKKSKYTEYTNEDIKHSGLFIAELYLEIDKNVIFGGNSDQAIANNAWNIAGEEHNLNDLNVTLYYTEGDTYYQRYDNLKTYPYSLEEYNGITDVISFMVETRINLDGRYDDNKAQEPHFHIFPNNFNLINKGYTLKNNFFNFYGIDYNKKESEYFPNTITWSKTKTQGETIDTWLNLTLASTLNIDGNYGKLNSLLNYNDNILAFQDKALNLILYNELNMITTDKGIPIELLNSGKVTGNRVLSNKIGCTNKWSICQTPSGIYFLDSYNKDLYKYGNEGFLNISEIKGFNTYLKSIKNIDKIWNPKDFYSIKTSYDSINKEILFCSKDETLSYSEQLLEFMSFYDYKIYYIDNIKGKNLVIGNKKLYEYQEGNYNYYFDELKPYSVEFLSNPLPFNDKVFNTIDLRSDVYYDMWQNGVQYPSASPDALPFNIVQVSNSYQNTGETSLIYNKYGLGNISKKFRNWKIILPRDKEKINDRIRDIWAKIKLKRSTEKPNCKVTIHDIIVTYNV